MQLSTGASAAAVCPIRVTQLRHLRRKSAKVFRRYVFSCDQAALQMVLSVSPSLRPSVPPFSLCSHHRIIIKFELLPMTKVRSMQKVKVRGQRLRSQRSKPNLTVSGLFEFTYDDEMMHTAWCCLEEGPYCFSRSSVKFQGHTAKKIVEFDPNWAFPDCKSSLNSPMATKLCTKLEVALKRCPIVFQSHLSNFKVTRL